MIEAGSCRLPWRVLLLGGPSGAGKSVAAERLGRRLGVPWLQVDDLRLALQHSGAAFPDGNEALRFFEQTLDVWSLSPERLRDALIDVGEAMAPAIEIVVANHVDTNAPVIVEGDGILPSLLDRPRVRERAASGHVRAVFLIEPDEEALLVNMRARARGVAGRTDGELRTEASAKRSFGEWLSQEAKRRGLPVVAPRPYATLPARLTRAVTG